VQPFARASDLTLAGNCSDASLRAVTPPRITGIHKPGHTLAASPPRWRSAPTCVSYSMAALHENAVRADRGRDDAVTASDETPLRYDGAHRRNGDRERRHRDERVEPDARRLTRTRAVPSDRRSGFSAMLS
jgi:hypothetical protein